MAIRKSRSTMKFRRMSRVRRKCGRAPSHPLRLGSVRPQVRLVLVPALAAGVRRQAAFAPCCACLVGAELMSGARSVRRNAAAPGKFSHLSGIHCGKSTPLLLGSRCGGALLRLCGSLYGVLLAHESFAPFGRTLRALVSAFASFRLRAGSVPRQIAQRTTFDKPRTYRAPAGSAWPLRRHSLPLPLWRRSPLVAGARKLCASRCGLSQTTLFNFGVVLVLLWPQVAAAYRRT